MHLYLPITFHSNDVFDAHIHKIKSSSENIPSLLTVQSIYQLFQKEWLVNIIKVTKCLEKNKLNLHIKLMSNDIYL